MNSISRCLLQLHVSRASWTINLTKCLCEPKPPETIQDILSYRIVRVVVCNMSIRTHSQTDIQAHIQTEKQEWKCLHKFLWRTTQLETVCFSSNKRTTRNQLIHHIELDTYFTSTYVVQLSWSRIQTHFSVAVHVLSVSNKIFPFRPSARSSSRKKNPL